MSFKIGDRVKRKENMWKGLSQSVIKENDILTVINLRFQETDYPSIEFKEVVGCWDQEFFELAEEMKTSKFKIGDRVISVKNTPSVEEGFIGIVNKIFYKEICPISVRSEVNENSIWCFEEDELELLSISVSGYNLPKDTKPEHMEYFKKVVDNVSNEPDVINSPKHYAVFESVEAIQVIASSMTQEQFYGYCLGNCLKYRLRAGAKDDVMQELGKANKYQELYTEHKHLCKEGK